jgi:DHA1 family tetracycline resistance protein-like MFS transporter
MVRCTHELSGRDACATRAGAESIYLAYTDSVFDWTPTDQGYALMCLGVGSAISNATISLQLWALGSGGVLLLGALSTLLFTLSGACIVAPWMVYVSIGLLLPFGFSWSTAAAGVIASELPKSQQGHLQGAVDSLLNIAQVEEASPPPPAALSLITAMHGSCQSMHVRSVH